MKLSKILCVILAVCMMMTLATMLVSCSEKEAATTAIQSVTLKKNKQTLELHATLDDVYAKKHAKGTLYVLALPSSDTSSIPSDVDVVGEVKVKGKISFKIPLVSDEGFSRIACAFVLAEKSGSSYVAITNARYAKNPELLADKQSSSPSPSDIKGLGGSDLFEAELLGADRALIEINILSLLKDERTADTVRYDKDGISYFFDKDAVQSLDQSVKQANELGMRVYLRTVYEKLPLEGVTDAISVPDIPALNDADEARTLSAFYSMLADRYSGEHGNVSDYVIGKNANDVPASFGGEDEQYEKLYQSWVRIAHASLVSTDSNARVYLSVSNEWKDAPAGVIGSKAFLTRFADASKRSGDYGWSVALDLGIGEDLPALLSDGTSSYSSLGVNNLSELSDLLDLAELRYESEKRSFIVDALSLPLTISEKNRATYYICAYYNALDAGAEAFIYSNYFGAGIYNKDGARSDLYYMMKLCGTNTTSQLSDYVVKAPSFSQDKLGAKQFKYLHFTQKPTYELPESVLKRRSDFPAGLDAFRENGNTLAFTSMRGGSTQRILNVTANTAAGLGAVTAYGVPAEDVRSAAYLGIRVASSNSPLLIVNISNNKGVDYTAEVQLVNGESDYYFDLSKIAKELDDSDTLTVSLCIASDDDRSGITVSNISLYGSSGTGSSTVITIIIVAACVLALVALTVFLVLRRKKKQEFREEI